MNAQLHASRLNAITPTGYAPALLDDAPIPGAAGTRDVPAADVVKKISDNWTLILSGLVLLVAFAWAIAPQLFTHADPISGSFRPLQAPSAEHLFGTDANGRDVLSRVIYGARQSLLAATLAVAFGGTVGTIIGVIAGSRGGLVDTILMRAVDVLLAIPSLLLSLTVVVVLGFGTFHAALAVGATSIATFARLARAGVVRVKSLDFVEAAYGSGSSYRTVLLRHILPHSLTAVYALAALQFGSAILQLSVLGFLGFGTPPPTPEWGLIISESRDFIATSWWLTLLPGAVIVAIVAAAQRVSQALGHEG